MNRKMWLRFRALVRHSLCGAEPVDADDPIHELRNGPGLRAACLDCCTCGRYRATGAAYYRGSGDSNGSGASGRASFAFGASGPSFGSNGESPGPHITSTYGSNNSSSGETFHFTDAGHMIPDEPLPAKTSLPQQPNRNVYVDASGSQSSGGVLNVVDVGGLPIAISPRPLAKDASGSWLDGKLRLSAHPVADVYRAP